MRTTGPATGTTFAGYQLGAYSLDMLPACLWLLNGRNPTNPLMARQWRNILPGRQSLRRSRKDFPIFIRHFVHHASRNFFLGHGFIQKSFFLSKEKFGIKSEQRSTLDVWSTAVLFLLHSCTLHSEILAYGTPKITIDLHHLFPCNNSPIQPFTPAKFLKLLRVKDVWPPHHPKTHPCLQN